jgi:hypothetical protein
MTFQGVVGENPAHPGRKPQKIRTHGSPAKAAKIKKSNKNNELAQN